VISVFTRFPCASTEIAERDLERVLTEITEHGEGTENFAKKFMACPESAGHPPCPHPPRWSPCSRVSPAPARRSASVIGNACSRRSPRVVRAPRTAL